MSDSEDDIAFWFLTETVRPLKKKKMWVHEFNKERQEGEYFRTCLPLHDYPDKFFKYFRMNVDTFNYILEAIQEDIRKQSNFREVVSPAEKLSITLSLQMSHLGPDELSTGVLKRHKK
ncbi:hypothetical protein QTP88_016710 [Uroleucon formosanum]